MLPFHHCKPLGLVGAEEPWARGGKAPRLLGSGWESRFLVAISSKGWGSGRSGVLAELTLWPFSAVPQVDRVSPSLVSLLPCLPSGAGEGECAPFLRAAKAADKPAAQGGWLLNTRT